MARLGIPGKARWAAGNAIPLDHDDVDNQVETERGHDEIMAVQLQGGDAY